MDTPAHPSNSAAASPPCLADRLALLRGELARRGLDGFIIPRSDEHQGEYVPPCAERLAWLTGFSGSAGVAVVLPDKAAIFVDGRYTLQVRAEVDTAAFELRHLIDHPPGQWIAEATQAGGRLGFDPRLHTPDQAATLRAACERTGATLLPCADNPLDAVWSDQPAPPRAPIRIHPPEFAGRQAADKRAELAGLLAAERLQAAVISDPSSLAWLLNIRGGDVPYAPLPLGFAVLHADATVALAMDPAKLSPDLVAHLGPEVALHPADQLGPILDRLAGARVRLDAASASVWIEERLKAAGARPERGSDLCALPKAVKNPVELEGARAAHRRDGVAMVRFLNWLATHAPQGGLDEMSAADRLEAFRRQGALFQDLSFPTISGAGANGAIVHYRSSPASNRPLAPGQLYLVDSGAQYLDGTTDITRTIAIGAPGEEERHRFTLVLKGHIAVASSRFPAGTCGSQLDALARRALWAEGLDYDHGTGHGVGSYLSVHEGPQRISKACNAVALRPGMILSNEPGYYRTGAYGIRIENLLAVVEDGGNERPFLAFETLTLAPIDRALIETGLLDAAERAWLDAYHARVRDTLSPLLAEPDATWLAAATAPLP